MLQLEMHQPLYSYNQQPLQQQQSTTVMQPTGAAPTVYYVLPSPVICEYASGQSKVASVILMTAGALSIVFSFLGMFFTMEFMTTYGHGIWCGAMVSSSVLYLHDTI